MKKSPRPKALIKRTLEKKDNGDKTEVELARSHYNAVPPPTSAYKFKRYRNHHVRVALDEVFSGKCAYCESTYSAVDSRNVEHFRPKGGVAGVPGHLGYWWLGATWSNLLASCPACNQRRRQLTFDVSMSLKDMEEACRKIPKNFSGKAESFPLMLEAHRCTKEWHRIHREDPLLINPCVRDPEDHLEWLLDWDKANFLWDAKTVGPVLKPRTVAGVEDLYGKMSIGIYGLNRIGLVTERMDHVRMLQRLSAPLASELRSLDAHPGGLGAPSEVLKQLVKGINECADRRGRYAGLSRAYIQEFRRELARAGLNSPEDFGVSMWR